MYSLLIFLSFFFILSLPFFYCPKKIVCFPIFPTIELLCNKERRPRVLVWWMVVVMSRVSFFEKTLRSVIDLTIHCHVSAPSLKISLLPHILIPTLSESQMGTWVKGVGI